MLSEGLVIFGKELDVSSQIVVCTLPDRYSFQWEDHVRLEFFARFDDCNFCILHNEVAITLLSFQKSLFFVTSKLRLIKLHLEPICDFKLDEKMLRHMQYHISYRRKKVLNEENKNED